MNNPTLVAVGSNKLVAKEIAGITKSFVGHELPIITKLTNDIKSAIPNTFYICATTQGKKLQAIIPDEQLFIFDLHPTTRFFLDIARIPAGETVSIFNNLLPYTEVLMRECQELGITELNFEPIAFEEMPISEVAERLQRARWIVGAEPFMDNSALLSPTYKNKLPCDVTIISGHRMASVASAAKLLTALANYYDQALFLEYQKLKQQKIDTELTAQNIAKQFDNLSAQIIKTVKFLQDAALESIKQQIGSTAEVIYRDLPTIVATPSYSLEQARTTAKEQLHTLKWLLGRLETLAKS